jgi:hypothetical protein
LGPEKNAIYAVNPVIQTINFTWLAAQTYPDGNPPGCKGGSRLSLLSGADMHGKIALEEHFATADTIKDSQRYFTTDAWPASHGWTGAVLNSRFFP